MRAAELLAKLGLAPRDVQEAYRSLLLAKDISIRLSAAEHLVTLESAQGGEVVEALCSVLTADRHSWYSERAFNTLFSLGDKGLSTLVAEIQGDSSEALRACQRIARGEEFTTKDARAIVKLLRADGKPKTPWGFKQSLFKWVWDHVEQRVGAVAVQ